MVKATPQQGRIDKWVLGSAEAPPNFWYLYLKDIALSHTPQRLIMCSEVSTPKLFYLRPCTSLLHGIDHAFS